MQSIESALDMREGLAVMRARAAAAAVVEKGTEGRSSGHQAFLERLLGA